jgi:hypothetical protein
MLSASGWLKLTKQSHGWRLVGLKPRPFGNSWPAFQSMPPAEQQAFLNELMRSGQLQDCYADQNKTRILSGRNQQNGGSIALARQVPQGRPDITMIVTGWADQLLRPMAMIARHRSVSLTGWQ